MTDSQTLARPPQVTMASWVAMIGSVFVVFGAFSLVADLRTLETREQVERTLSEWPASSFGLGVEGYLDLLHVAAMVTAGCAVATAILGWYVRTRSRSARLALTIMAVPLFVAGAFTDGFLSSMVAFSTIFLWLRPSRDWFDGITPARREARLVTTPAARATESSQTPPALGQLPGVPPPATAPVSQAERPAFTTARPVEVLQACLLTWICAGLVLVVMALLMMSVLLAPDAVRNAYADSAQAEDFSFATFKRAILLVGGAFALWSLAAVVVAIFAMVGRNWARIALMASASGAAVLFLFTAPSAAWLLIPMIPCVATVVLLLRPSVVAWYTRRY